MNKIILCLLIVSILLPSCIKTSSGPTVIHETINSDLLAHYNFKVGSYWVYKDSITGKKDSLYVISNTFTSDKVTDEKIVDNINIVIGNHADNPTRLYDSIPWAINLTEQFMGIIVTGKTIAPFITEPINLGIIPGTKIGIITNIFPAYTLNGNSFPNVLEINDTFFTNTSYKEYYNDWFYLSDSIGLVKLRLNHPHDTVNKILELERWKIVK